MWPNFTSDRWVLDMVCGLAIELGSMPSQLLAPDSAPKDPTRDALLGAQIDTMLEQGILEPAYRTERAFVSHMFLRPKTDGKYRPILNLSDLNKYTVYRHFKMDHLTSVMRILPKGSYMSSIDITQAYHALPVRDRDRDLLQLQYHGSRYRFTCLPNGYSPGPRVFTRIMKALMAHLRVKYGVNLVFYIDDTLIYGETREAVREFVIHTLRVLQEAGFTINYKKSVLEPERVIDYLGFQIDSTTLTLTIPKAKTESLLELGTKLIGQFRMPIRKFARMVGKFAATDAGNDRAKVHIKWLQIVKQRALCKSGHDYDANIYLNAKTRECIQGWLHHIPLASAKYDEVTPQEIVFTDASKTGWGCYWVGGDYEYGEEWPVDVKELHINILELQAILLALKILCTSVRNKLIHLFIDNTTAISCIRKGGSTHSLTCNAVTYEIYQYAWSKGITFKLAYCPTAENVNADRASRAFATSAEWTLAPAILLKIEKRFNKTLIDLFASSLNHVCPKYVTMHYDANAMATDAFSMSWTTNSHIFPPFSLVGRVLRKIKKDKTRGVLVVPEWKTQPWYSDLSRLRRFNQRLKIPVTPTTLQWPADPSQHFPLAGRCTLLVIPL